MRQLCMRSALRTSLRQPYLQPRPICLGSSGMDEEVDGGGEGVVVDLMEPPVAITVTTGGELAEMKITAGVGLGDDGLGGLGDDRLRGTAPSWVLGTRPGSPPAEWNGFSPRTATCHGVASPHTQNHRPWCRH